MMSELDEFWHTLVPREFPYAGDLLRRMPVPIFFKSATHSIALHNAIGDSNIIRTIQGTLAITSWEANSLVGIGIVMDADSDISPLVRFENIKKEVQQHPQKTSSISSDVPWLSTLLHTIIEMTLSKVVLKASNR